MGDPRTVLDTLGANADWFLHRIDLAGERALLVRLEPEAIASAAFLDERVLEGRRDGFWLPLGAVLEAGTRVPARTPHAIFHIGHCGSTLLSRVLARWPGTRGLREPLPLRTLAETLEELPRATARLDHEQWQALFDLALRLYARGGHVTVKATSSCNALVAPWLAREQSVRALLLHVDLRTYLATILKAPGARSDCMQFAPARLGVLHVLLGDDAIRLPALDVAQRIALGWVAELARFLALEQAHPLQALRVDFDDFLAAPPPQLARIARHFALPADDAALRAALDPAVLGSYAKSTAHAYDADARAADLAESERRFGAELRDGLDFAQALVACHAPLAALGPLLERAPR